MLSLGKISLMLHLNLGFRYIAKVRSFFFCALQSKRADGEEEKLVCEHVYEIKNDVGKVCSLCGLIKEDIKDMTFTWRRPV
jgi:hypothetical protein